MVAMRGTVEKARWLAPAQYLETMEGPALACARVRRPTSAGRA